MEKTKVSQDLPFGTIKGNHGFTEIEICKPFFYAWSTLCNNTSKSFPVFTVSSQSTVGTDNYVEWKNNARIFRPDSL